MHAFEGRRRGSENRATRMAPASERPRTRKLLALPVPMVIVDNTPPIAVIRLSRPEKRNAMTPEMLRELLAAIQQPPDGTRALVICGVGAAFCAGFDLAMCKADTSGKTMRELLSGLSACVRWMRASALPIVVAAHGSAIAGGCALVAAADVVVADRGCKLGYPVVRIGVSPAVNAPFVNEALGPGRSRERLLDTALVRAEHADGLVHELVDGPADVLARAMAVAGQLAAKGPAAIAATKKLLADIAATRSMDAAERSLAASLSLVGGDEERRMLGALSL